MLIDRKEWGIGFYISPVESDREIDASRNRNPLNNRTAIITRARPRASSIINYMRGLGMPMNKESDAVCNS